MIAAICFTSACATPEASDTGHEALDQSIGESIAWSAVWDACGLHDAGRMMREAILHELRRCPATAQRRETESRAQDNIKEINAKFDARAGQRCEQMTMGSPSTTICTQTCPHLIARWNEWRANQQSSLFEIGFPCPG
jgi:hypothetical protein